MSVIQGSGDITVFGGTLVHGNVTIQQGHSAFNRLWRQLHTRVSADAIHDSEALTRQGICLERTREIVLKLLNDYLTTNQPQTPRLLWLNGPAGAGKSAIARTIAVSTNEDRRLIGSFFFFTSDSKRNTITPLIPTLAVQVCRVFRQARKSIEQALEDDPLIFSKSIAVQADALVVQPLVEVGKDPAFRAGKTPFVLLVDGLDECVHQQSQIEVIDTLVRIVEGVQVHASLQLKVILFSRPERWIRNRISYFENTGQAWSVALDHRFDARTDIKFYYDAHFRKIRQDHPMGLILDPDWPSVEEMGALMDITGDHFAFAHTVQIFVADPNEDPTEQLRIVLRLIPGPFVSPHTYLDQLYNTIFSRIPSKVLPQALRVVGAFLVPSPYSLNPSPLLLELVFDLKRGTIQRIFFHLESLFDLGNRISNWIHVYHKTLTDFLFDASRSEQYGLFIDKDAIYQDICASIRAVFLRETRPDREALVEFYIYLRKLKGVPSHNLPVFGNGQEPPLSGQSPRMSQPYPKWPLWAIQFYHSLFPTGTAIPGFGIKPPSLMEYSVQMFQDARRHDPHAKGPKEVLSVYDGSSPGRLCLVLAGCAVSQTYSEKFPLFHQAFIRSAIQSRTILSQQDATVGWNLLTCNLDNLSKASICFAAQPPSYVRAIQTQVVHDTFDPDWHLSRLAMLLPWHDGGHQSSDDPWQHAPAPSVASRPPPQCQRCIDVLTICQAHIITQIVEISSDPRSLLNQDLFSRVSTRWRLWENSRLIRHWGETLVADSRLFNSTPQLRNIGRRVQIQWHKLLGDINQKVVALVQGVDELDEDTAWKLVYQPYSRACIPFETFDDHAIRVARRRAAWKDKTELPELIYTYPSVP